MVRTRGFHCYGPWGLIPDWGTKILEATCRSWEKKKKMKSDLSEPGDLQLVLMITMDGGRMMPTRAPGKRG